MLAGSSPMPVVEQHASSASASAASSASTVTGLRRVTCRPAARHRSAAMSATTSAVPKTDPLKIARCIVTPATSPVGRPLCPEAPRLSDPASPLPPARMVRYTDPAPDPTRPMTEKPTILITGGAQRIGLHCAQRLVEDGYRVIITCRQARPDWQDNPLQGIEVLLADFSSVEGIRQLVDTLIERRVRL